MVPLKAHSQAQVDVAVGYDYQRRRLEQRHILVPPAKKFFGSGQTLMLYPEFNLVGLILGSTRPSGQDEQLLRGVSEVSQWLFSQPAVERFGALARPHLRKGWSLDSLVVAIAGEDAQAIDDFQGALCAAEDQLTEAGIWVNTTWGSLVGLKDGLATIDIAGELVRMTPSNARAARLDPGSSVARQIVHFGSRVGELLIPSISVSSARAALGIENAHARDASDPRSAEMPVLDVTPRYVPELNRQSDETGPVEGFVAYQPPPEIKLDFNRSAFRVNPMRRDSHRAA